MQNKRNCMFFILSFLFLLIFLGKSNFVQAADYNDMGTKSNIEADKSWVVEFNKKIDKNTINNSNILVTDENGQQVPINISIRDDESSITISPKDKYAYGKTYSLTIGDGLKAQNGNIPTKPAKMKFSIKDNPTNVSDKNFTVCLDAGHGGDDTGNIGQSGIKEKDVDLSVALKVGAILKDSGVNVVYTRTSDNITWTKDNDLKSRFDISNSNKADFFVSIHSNYISDNQTANGIETYYFQPDAIGKNLAQAVQDELVSSTWLNNRGIKVGLPQHEILRGTSASAVMIELGFMSNPKESAALGTEDFQSKSASAIAAGILKSINLVDKSKHRDISSVNDISANVTEGSSYDLPISIQATMSDGSSKQVGVIWDNKSVDTSKTGIYKYQGIAAGYSTPVNLILTVAAKPDPSSNNVIVIDPGHGIGSDTGATGIDGLQEDDVTLAVGLKVGKILQDHGINVVYTRTEDMRSTPMSVTDSLQKRCDISNNANAKYFVSIHANSFDDTSANGTETLYYTGNAEGEKLASAIQNSIVKEVGTYDRGLKDGSWLYVAKNTNAPAVLTELGFLTNPDDAAKLRSDEYQQKFAQAIADGILQTLGVQ